MAWSKSISFDVANDIFSPIGIVIIKNEELNIYSSCGKINLQNRTLSGLCKALVVELANLKDKSDDQ
jgi:hypothetical protein